MEHSKIAVGDRVQLRDHPKLHEYAGKTGEVVRKTPKLVWVMLDDDVVEYGERVIYRRDVEAFARGDEVRNVQGDVIRNSRPDDDMFIDFFQVAEEFAVGIAPTAVEEITGRRG